MAQLLQNAALGTLLILTSVLLRRVLRGRLVPEARLVLWGACLVRLLTPAALESVLSLWGPLATPSPVPGPPGAPTVLPSGPPVQPVPGPVQPPLAAVSPAPGFIAPPALPGPQPAPSALPWGAALAVVWLGVGLILAVRYVLSWRRTRRAVASAVLLGREDPRYRRLPRCARLREGPVEGAPLTFGVVRPTVVLPPGLWEGAAESVLAHEGVHAARRDNLWHYVMALALVVHWWNPAVWLMSRLLRRDIELACDRAVVSRLSREQCITYAKTLITLATKGEGPSFSQAFGQKLTEERIAAIMNYKKLTALGLALTVLLVSGVTVALATEPVTPQPDPAPAVTETEEDESQPLESASQPAEPTGIRVEVKDQSVLDAARDKIDGQIQELMGEILEEELAGKSGESEEQSDCPHLRVIHAARCIVHVPISEAGHVTIDLNCAWCISCEELVVVSRVRTEESHSFWVRNYTGGSHDGTEPGQHCHILSSWCSNCNYKNDYMISSGCQEGSCVEFQSLTPEEQSALVHNVYTPSSYSYGENGYSLDSDGNAQVYDKSSKRYITVKWGYLPCIKRDCQVPYDHCHVERELVRIYGEDPGLLCACPDCSSQERHEHAGVTYAGKAPGRYIVLSAELDALPPAVP